MRKGRLRLTLGALTILGQILYNSGFVSSEYGFFFSNISSYIIIEKKKNLVLYINAQCNITFICFIIFIFCSFVLICKFLGIVRLGLV